MLKENKDKKIAGDDGKDRYSTEIHVMILHFSKEMKVIKPKPNMKLQMNQF